MRIPHDGTREASRLVAAAGGRRNVLKNFQSALNRLNSIPSCETFLSRELFLRNSWLTRHSARIMFGLPEITRDLSRALLQYYTFPSFSLRARQKYYKSRRSNKALCIKSTNNLINRSYGLSNGVRQPPRQRRQSPRCVQRVRNN